MLFGKADLHLHTTASDGQLSPDELVRLVGERGINVISITDHDTVAGLEAARPAGARFGVEIIPGVELSATVGGEEVHLLGYFFDTDNEDLLQHLAQFRDGRYRRAAAMVERLRMAGITLNLEHIQERAGGGALGRPHVAAALVEGGHVATRREAFQRYLSPGGAAYVPRARFAAAEALALLHSAGGIGVLAHPGQWTSSRALDTLIRLGLDGIETLHPMHTPWLQAYYHAIAREKSLIETGGSDFHGWRTQDADNLGRYTLTFEQVDAVRRKAAASV